MVSVILLVAEYKCFLYFLFKEFLISILFFTGGNIFGRFISRSLAHITATELLHITSLNNTRNALKIYIYVLKVKNQYHNSWSYLYVHNSHLENPYLRNFLPLYSCSLDDQFSSYFSFVLRLQ